MWRGFKLDGCSRSHAATRPPEHEQVSLYEGAPGICPTSFAAESSLFTLNQLKTTGGPHPPAFCPLLQSTPSEPLHTKDTYSSLHPTPPWARPGRGPLVVTTPAPRLAPRGAVSKAPASPPR
jgi:hypothetical protein